MLRAPGEVLNTGTRSGASNGVSSRGGAMAGGSEVSGLMEATA